MKHTKYAIIALSILAATLVFWLFWMYSCQLTVQLPTTYEAVKTQTDSVIVLNTDKPDPAKLRIVEDFKRRIAAKKYDDSLKRVQNKR